MPTRVAEAEVGKPGVGAAAKQVAEHASALARLELELAALELKKKIVALGLGAGLLIGAAVFVATWVALLIVTGALGLLVGAFGLLGLRLVRKGTPPVPKQAIAEAKKTTAALRSSNGHG